MDCHTNLSRKSRSFSVLAVAFFVTLLALQPGYSEQNSALPDVTAAVETGTVPATSNGSIRPFSKIAIGVTVGMLGPGVEVATPISNRTNLRVDGSFFNYTLSSISEDNVNYGGNLKLRDLRASYDFFPFHGSFRLSAGVEVYNKFNVNATASLPVGQDIKLNGNEYYSDGTMGANASLVYGNKVAPTASFGWGNAIPRSHHHFAFPVEIGAAYTGVPTFALTASGNGCAVSTCTTVNSTPISSVPGFTNNLNAQIAKVKNDLSPARFYPIINAGVTYKF